MEELRIKRTCPYSFCAASKIGEWLYFSCTNRNGLYRLNLESGNVELIGIFPVEQEYQFAFSIENEIWFLPSAGTRCEICVYDIAEEKFKYTKLPNGKGGRFFSAYIEEEEELWILPCDYEMIIKIYKSDRRIELIELIDMPMTNQIENYTDAVKYNEYIYISPFNGSHIIKYDTGKMELDVINWPYEERKCQKLVYFKNNLYFLSRNKREKIVKMDLLSETFEEIDLKIEDTNELTLAIGYKDSIVWMLPSNSDTIEKIDLSDYSVSYIVLRSEEGGALSQANYRMPILLENELIFPTYLPGSQFVKVDSNNNLSAIPFQCNEDELIQYLKILLKKDKVVDGKKDKSIGENIYNLLINE